MPRRKKDHENEQYKLKRRRLDIDRHVDQRDRHVDSLECREHDAQDRHVDSLQRREHDAQDRHVDQRDRHINNVDRHLISIEQEWDYENPCKHCGYISLKSHTKAQRKKCCQNGRACTDDDDWPQLNPFPKLFEEILQYFPDHMSSQSAFYNKLFSIASVGVENDRGNHYEKIFTPHAVKLCGSTYHFIGNNSSKSKGGLFYFTYDGALGELLQHAESLNNNYADTINEEVLKGNLCYTASAFGGQHQPTPK